MSRTVLITGCSSGFGRLTARTFQDAGWNVVATMRAPERVPELADHDRMLVLRLDVTDLPVRHRRCADQQSDRCRRGDADCDDGAGQAPGIPGPARRHARAPVCRLTGRAPDDPMGRFARLCEMSKSRSLVKWGIPTALLIVLIVAVAGALATRKTFLVEIWIPAPPEAVWAVLIDTGAYPQWNPVFVEVDGAYAEGETVLNKVPRARRRHPGNDRDSGDPSS